MKDILKITGQPGLSVGVLHRGQVVLRHNMGMKDLETKEEPDADTLYCIASLTKALTAACLDQILVEKGISWHSRVSSTITEFRSQHDPALISRMTLLDALSHRTGLSSFDQIFQGLDGEILAPKEKA